MYSGISGLRERKRLSQMAVRLKSGEGWSSGRPTLRRGALQAPAPRSPPGEQGGGDRPDSREEHENLQFKQRADRVENEQQESPGECGLGVPPGPETQHDESRSEEEVECPEVWCGAAGGEDRALEKI